MGVKAKKDNACARQLLALFVGALLTATMLMGCALGSSAPQRVDVAGMTVSDATRALRAEGWSVEVADLTPYSDYSAGGVEMLVLPGDAIDKARCGSEVATQVVYGNEAFGSSSANASACLVCFESGKQSCLEEWYDLEFKAWKSFYKDYKEDLNEGMNPQVIGEYALQNYRRVYEYEADRVPVSCREKRQKMLKKCLKQVKKCGVAIPDDLKGESAEVGKSSEKETGAEKESSKKKDTAKKKGSSAKKSKKKSAAEESAISWKKAGQHIGEVVTVKGPVVSTKYASSSNGSPTFLNVGAAYPSDNRVTITIWGENRGNFSRAPESLYQGKTVCVTGEVYVYNGACNIEVTSPSQIVVVD